ncbi:hypothetical protein ASD24_12230 [Paenibacillus sp. Root52]|uniref:Uncharacterized protein n=1 Tax=Paenibacillus amylolyticus TaxID=1451 RepID=A0AAP5H1I1_PAEAM|nr:MULTISPECIES: hypothetical protein [Paenibacillus]KQY83050.1 hypothetical protein ASD24_12230 [Paenibacillus sp. Root52]MDR6722399.1 hypothetical protein [Paenibacillus amylolyticus]
MINDPITTYEEAVQRIQSIGILPLAPLFPEYPSLSSLTPQENWHKDNALDPWLWRTRFAEEGIAAYGKCIKKKAVLISRDYFPLIHRLLADQTSIQEQYDAGLRSREALKLYERISEQEGIDGRALRAQTGFAAKEYKKSFDQGLLELQSKTMIVISGTKEKEGLEEGKVAWNSSAYETTGHWMNSHGVRPFSGSIAEAQALLVSKLEPYTPPIALSKIKKALGIR